MLIFSAISLEVFRLVYESALVYELKTRFILLVLDSKFVSTSNKIFEYVLLLVISLN